MVAVAKDAGLYSAQRGGALHKWKNNFSASGGTDVGTQATLYHNLASGEVVMVTAMHFDMQTANKDCHFHLIGCTGTAGSGTATALSGHTHIFTGSAVDGSASKRRPFEPPIRARYEDGVHSITIQLEASAAATVSCGWSGYRDLSLAT